ncbi:SPOR domain-containing protein [Bacteroides sp. 51]|uniref:HU domain-containing protein n=1 Tax=Bacteroides sp. 51 TaxID=2302938 RepID=UPI0013D3E4A3|nr:SPOR domain-containing protein [Bacteroides sp. 51]NDV83703.1 SPOR domain-containing protein [Bacteroides sp. 51]
MIELVRHIEILLLENDCVVVPGFGGFITHYMPASWNDEEKLFLPPMRTIGFNPQLKMNDGILVQSYMEVYNTDFSDATKILEQEVDKFIGLLHKEGKVELANIGELSLSIHGTYVFLSYDEKIISPLFYGLDSFEMKDIRTLLQQSPAKEMTISQPKATTAKKMYEIRINRALVRNAVAAVAAIFLFFFMSAPIENTYVEKENYAQLLPADLFGKIEQHSLLTTPIINTSEINVEIQPEAVADNSLKVETEVAQQEKTSVPVAVKEVKVAKGEVQKASISQEVTKRASKLHHIIVASLASENDAHTMVSDLKQQGYSNACVLTGEARVRVSIGSYNTREEADRQIVEIRKNNAYKSAWLLVR